MAKVTDDNHFSWAGNSIVADQKEIVPVPEGYDAVLADIVSLLESARRTAARAVNTIITARTATLKKGRSWRYINLQALVTPTRKDRDVHSGFYVYSGNDTGSPTEPTAFRVVLPLWRRIHVEAKGLGAHPILSDAYEAAPAEAV